MGVSQIEDRTKGLVVVAVWCPFKAQPRGINKTRPNVKGPKSDASCYKAGRLRDLGASQTGLAGPFETD